MAPEKINGEHGKIIDAIHLVALQLEMVKTKQEANHNSNKEQIERILAKVNRLPCEAHIEKFEGYDITRKVLVGTIFGVVCCVVAFAVAWGSLNNDVENHHIQADKMWEKCCSTK